MGIDVVKNQFRTDVYGAIPRHKQIGRSHVLTWKSAQITLMMPHRNHRLEWILQQVNKTVVPPSIDVVIGEVPAALKPADCFQAAGSNVSEVIERGKIRVPGHTNL